MIEGLAEIAADHDALICDVWGVIHDGPRHHPDAAEALTQFPREHGPVVLLTNAPRVPAEVAAQCAAYGLPPGCYDAIVSSGGAAREMLARRGSRTTSTLPLYYIGPDRDLPMLEGLDMPRTGIDDAALVLCIGLVDDHDRDAGRLCRAAGGDAGAGPDHAVRQSRHGGASRPAALYCAGALAQDYEALGGKVIYYGKPHLPVYRGGAGRGGQGGGRPRQAAAGGGRRAVHRHHGRQRARAWMCCSSPMACMARRSSLIPPRHLAELFASYRRHAPAAYAAR